MEMKIRYNYIIAIGDCGYLFQIGIDVVTVASGGGLSILTYTLSL